MDLENEFEGCKLTAYQDGGGIWTIGWGHTGPEVHADLVWTQQQADEQLTRDKARAQAVIDELVTDHLNVDEDLAIRDLIFNIGAGNFAHSTLLRKLNAGDLNGAAAEFDKWDHVAGRVSAGLLRRRQMETALFEQGINTGV